MTTGKMAVAVLGPLGTYTHEVLSFLTLTFHTRLDVNQVGILGSVQILRIQSRL